MATNAIFFGVPWFAICYAVQLAVVAALFRWKWAAVYAVALPYTGAVARLFRDRVLDCAAADGEFFRAGVERARREQVQQQARALVGDIQQLLTEVRQ